jgi:hypothetical protein
MFVLCASASRRRLQRSAHREVEGPVPGGGLSPRCRPGPVRTPPGCASGSTSTCPVAVDDLGLRRAGPGRPARNRADASSDRHARPRLAAPVSSDWRRRSPSCMRRRARRIVRLRVWKKSAEGRLNPRRPREDPPRRGNADLEVGRVDRHPAPRPPPAGQSRCRTDRQGAVAGAGGGCDRGGGACKPGDWPA